MKMNKILAASLISAVAITAAPEASADVCGNGGFYIGVNAGAAISRTKTKTTARTYTQNDKYHGIQLSGTTNDDVYYAKANEESSEVARVHKVKKTKTRFLAELVLGYDWRVNDIMIGVDLNLGSTFGKIGLKTKTEKYDFARVKADKDEEAGANPVRIFAKLKSQWHIALMPRVGYLITPQLEGYVTAGVKMTRFKLETYKYADWDLRSKDEAETLGFEDSDMTGYYSKLKKSKCRFIPVVGAGIRYEITPELYTKLEYNYEFRTNVKVHKESFNDNLSKLKVRTQAHVIKLGLGYRF